VTYFPPVERWLLPSAALSHAIMEMARDGRQGNEGIAMWLGTRRDGLAKVTHVAVLRGPGVQKGPDLITLSPAMMNKITLRAADLGLSLLGQIHSHGTEHGTSLSFTDREQGIRVLGYLSVVAPGYAQRSDTRLEDCGVHVFELPHGFRRMHLDEIRARVTVAASPIRRVLIEEST
jgi:hypothetical protein